MSSVLDLLRANGLDAALVRSMVISSAMNVMNADWCGPNHRRATARGWTPLTTIDVIRNQSEYDLTKSQADRCRAAIERAVGAGPSKGMDPRLHTASVDAMRRQLEELETQLREYKAGLGKPSDSRS